MPIRKRWSHVALLLFFIAAGFLFHPAPSYAKNIHNYSDTITDSRPLAYANHTFDFKINTDVDPGGSIQITFPSGFIVRSTSTFAARDVELYVNGVRRSSGETLGPTTDKVTIITGEAGGITYQLNSTTGISAGSKLELRVGTQASTANHFSINYSTSTGTTTTIADILPVRNSTTTGTKKVHINVTGASDQTSANFNIAIIHPVGIGPGDTTETVPPYRFNGAPTGEIGGTTLYVELSLETDEFATCKYDQTASTSFLSMHRTFSDTGSVIHTQLVQVATDTVNTYYVRCIDDEGNYNKDDYVISFTSPEPPTGQPNADGNVEGDGTGTGNSGSGSESGSGSSGSGGSGSGSSGNSSGNGGSGGGSGGSSGPKSDGQSGGGFEPVFGPYPSGDAQLIVNGYAFPRSKVYLLVDGTAAISRNADSSGKFSITLDSIAHGVYTFGVYAVDSNSAKSTTFSTSFTVTGGKTSSLSNIVIAPSIKVDPDPVTPGTTLHVTGFTLPDATVTIQNQKKDSGVSQKVFTADADNRGAWSVDIDTGSFDNATYGVRAKAQQSGGTQQQTDYSDYTYYGVGSGAQTPSTADLNQDGSVNLTDFSILLYWWNTDGGDSDPSADINGDGTVSLTDFSIMLYNWTG